MWSVNKNYNYNTIGNYSNLYLIVYLKIEKSKNYYYGEKEVIIFVCQYCSIHSTLSSNFFIVQYILLHNTSKNCYSVLKKIKINFGISQWRLSHEIIYITVLLHNI